MQTQKPPQKLLDQMRTALQTQHYSSRTEETYVEWARRYILYHKNKNNGIARHPREMGEPEIIEFITHLATERQVSASTQNQAISALIFLYNKVLNQPVKNIDVLRPRKPERLPTVLSKGEAQSVIAAMTGVYQLMAKILYGAGLRLIECLRLRVKDIDFENNSIIVRDGKGEKDRVTMLPQSLITPLKEHLAHVKQQHQQDLAEGYGSVYLPYALEQKYTNASKEWAWQYIFPARSISVDPQTQIARRHHLDAAR